MTSISGLFPKKLASFTSIFAPCTNTMSLHAPALFLGFLASDLNDYRAQFFVPLEKVVLTNKDPYTKIINTEPGTRGSQSLYFSRPAPTTRIELINLSASFPLWTLAIALTRKLSRKLQTA